MPIITETFLAPDRASWRAWLEEHHSSKSEIWLILYKKHTGKARVSLDAAVEEALCFGWIDGRLRRLDDEKHALRFTPRKPGSIWSESNKARVRKMTRQGKMAPAGLAAVRAGKQSGEWHKATLRESMDALPPELERALSANKLARENFARLAPSHRKAYIYWVGEAKREETRQRRVADVVRRAEQNRKPGAAR